MAFIKVLKWIKILEVKGGFGEKKEVRLKEIERGLKRILYVIIKSLGFILKKMGNIEESDKSKLIFLCFFLIVFFESIFDVVNFLVNIYLFVFVFDKKKVCVGDWFVFLIRGKDLKG